MKKETQALLILILASFLWGTTFWFIKVALSTTSALNIVSLRFLLAALSLFPFVVYSRKYLKTCLLPGFFLSIPCWLGFSSQAVGLYFIPATHSGFLTSMYLLFVPLFLFIFKKELLTLPQILALFTSLCGIWILTGGIQGVNQGDALTLFCAATFGLHILLSDRYSKNGLHIIVLNFIQFLFVGLFNLITSFLLKEPLHPPPLNTWLILIYLGVVGTSLCLFLQLSAQRFLSPMKTTFTLMVEPISAALFAWGIGHESFNLKVLLGGCLILFSLFISEWKAKVFLVRKTFQ